MSDSPNDPAGPSAQAGVGSSEGLLPQLVDHLRAESHRLREEWARRITEAELLTAMTPEEIFAEATAVYDNYVEVLETGSVEALQAYARDLSERIIPRGVETHEVLGIVLLLRDVLARSLFEKYQTDFDLLNRVSTPTNRPPTASPTRWASASCRNASASSASSRRPSASCPPRFCRCASNC